MVFMLIDLARTLWRGYTTAKYWLALKITAGVSTMECALLFAVLAILGFPGRSATAAAYVQWVSQTLIQLVMLSVLSVQQKITADRQTAHHQELTAVHAAHTADIADLKAHVHASHAEVTAQIGALAPPARRTAAPARDARGRFTTQPAAPARDAA